MEKGSTKNKSNDELNKIYSRELNSILFYCTCMRTQEKKYTDTVNQSLHLCFIYSINVKHA